VERRYENVKNRRKWFTLYTEGTLQCQQQLCTRRQHGPGTGQCGVCKRWFCREADKARHKCTSERDKPIEQQQGSVQCPTCGRRFRSKGGVAVHHCHCVPVRQRSHQLYHLRRPVRGVVGPSADSRDGRDTSVGKTGGSWHSYRKEQSNVKNASDDSRVKVVLQYIRADLVPTQSHDVTHPQPSL